jgi:CheY-like chemotaxis protein
MREISVAVLRDEVIHLGAIIVQTRILHPSGVKLHSPGDVLGLSQVKILQQCGVQSIILLEPGEGPVTAEKTLTTELVRLEDLQPGDELSGDLRKSGGPILLPASTILTTDAIQSLKGSGVEGVTIKQRNLEALTLQARSYLSSLPPSSERALRPDSRVTKITEIRASPVRMLFVAHGRVAVAVRGEFQRAVVLNTLLSEGHDAVEYRSVDEAAQAAQMGVVEILVIDLADAALATKILRTRQDAPRVAILVLSEQEKTTELHKAFEAGVNDFVPLPPRREILLEMIRGCLQVMGRSVTVKPSIRVERRKVPREGGHFVCGLVDKFISKSLSVSTATVIDISDFGLRIEYAAAMGGDLNAYRPGSVHPRHYFYHYSKASALARDLTVVLPSPGGPSLEGFVRFVHIARNKELDVAGLVFQRVHGSVREHMTTVRGKTTPGFQTRRF